MCELKYIQGFKVKFTSFFPASFCAQIFKVNLTNEIK